MGRRGAWRVIAFIPFEDPRERKHAFARFMAWARANCCGKCGSGDHWAHLLEDDGAIELWTRRCDSARLIARVLRGAPGIEAIVVNPNGELVSA